jgi:hypothetical protein
MGVICSEAKEHSRQPSSADYRLNAAGVQCLDQVFAASLSWLLEAYESA